MYCETECNNIISLVCMFSVLNIAKTLIGNASFCLQGEIYKSYIFCIFISHHSTKITNKKHSSKIKQSKYKFKKLIMFVIIHMNSSTCCTIYVPYCLCFLPKQYLIPLYQVSKWCSKKSIFPGLTLLTPVLGSFRSVLATQHNQKFKQKTC